MTAVFQTPIKTKFMISQCTLEVDLTKIKANYHILAGICKNSLIGACVKADGYGIGSNEIAKALAQENCKIFFVTTINEGISLRSALKTQNILILNGVFAKQEQEFKKYNLTPVLNSLYQVEIWNKFIIKEQKPLPCILHFNTGMNRLGIPHEEIEQLIKNPEYLTNALYIMSHLASAEESDNIYNAEQLAKFKKYLQYFPKVKASLANSSGIFLGEDYHFDLVRPGAALYGLNPYNGKKPNIMHNPITLTAPIIQLQKLKINDHIGYSSSFTIKKPSLIATIPIGYADGYSRSFSNCGHVFIGKHKAPVVGRVSMDLVNIDVTDVPSEEIFLDANVEIIGNQCTPDNIAHIIGTIGYEILTNLGNRYVRIYKNDM